MIVRVFRARIREGKVADFERLVREQSIPLLERSDGMMGYWPGKPLTDSSREFVMVTLWRDVEAVRAFAGDDWQQPILTDDERPLVKEMTADHYEWFDVRRFGERTGAPS